MRTNITHKEKIPLLFYPKTYITKDELNEEQTILKRNAIIDEFLNSLDNKSNNLDESGKTDNKERINNEEDDIDDFFKDIKYLKKIEKHNKNRELKELNKKRPKCYGRKKPSLLISNKNNNEFDNELNIEKCSTLSFDNNELNTNINKSKVDKIITPRCITNNNLISCIYKKNHKHKKLPKIDISNLIFRNTKINKYFLTSDNPIFTKSEYRKNINHIKNNNSKWINRKLLNNINRTQKNNLKLLNNEISNLSPILIAAKLYKNNTYFTKRLKRNFTSKVNKNINIKRILSEKNENKKTVYSLNNNNKNNSKKTSVKINSFRKLKNNNNSELNWINTVINSKNNFKNIKINKNGMNKKQLKVKLAELEINYKLKYDGKNKK